MRVRIWLAMIAIAFVALLVLVFKIVFESGYSVVHGRLWRIQTPWENW